MVLIHNILCDATILVYVKKPKSFKCFVDHHGYSRILNSALFCLRLLGQPIGSLRYNQGL